MEKSLHAHLHKKAHEAIRTALDAAGLQDVKEIRLAPPADPSMGDLGMACHPFARILRKNPKLIAEELAALIPETEGLLPAESLNAYLNLRFDPAYLIPRAIQEVWDAGESLGHYSQHKGEKILVEFSGPNTNKPQHLGHVRNNTLGLSMTNLLEAVGYEVVRTNIINDRGIHICKSMLAYKLWGEGKTPQSEGRKGDFFVGDYYVLFDQKLKEELAVYLQEHPESEIAEDAFFSGPSKLGEQAREMLLAWEAGDEEVRALWEKMNGWVYEGFDETYARMGIEFAWIDYESDTYELGKQVVADGMEQGVFYKRDDGAVVCDLEKIGKDGQKVLLRSDGTSVYMTQDLGTAMRRFDKFDPKRMIYVVGDEQNYHFEVLFGLLSLLQDGLGEQCAQLSYGMVELPEGKMKSREGTVVDADNLMDELHEMAKERVLEHFSDLEEDEVTDRAEKIGQAGLKFYLLKHAPASRMHFDPHKSIDFQGETGPYCLYSYARGNSIIAKVLEDDGPAVESTPSTEELSTLGSDKELAVCKTLLEFPQIVSDAAEQHNPARLAHYLWRLAHTFSSFYQDRDHKVLGSPSPLLEARIALIKAVQAVLKRGVELLGFHTIEQM